MTYIIYYEHATVVFYVPVTLNN